MNIPDLLYNCVLIRTDSKDIQWNGRYFLLCSSKTLTVAGDGYRDRVFLRDGGHATIHGFYGNREVFIVFSIVVT